MNLTSKRLLQFIAGCAGVCAFTAAADTTYYVQDTFEETSGILYSWDGVGLTDLGVLTSNGMDAAFYKGAVYSGDHSSLYTNKCAWLKATGDASVLTNVTFTYGGSSKPLAGALGARVLSLETEGQTLTRALAASQNFGVSDVYVDTLIKFTPSEDTPTIADDVKAAVFVNVNSNLVVYHGGSALVSTEVGQHIEPAQWYRLTILMSKLGELGNGGETVFKVYIDGVAITSAAGFDDNLDPNGPWFKVANGATTLSSVAFQGTGMVDELVVADSALGINSTAILLTLSFDSTISSVYDTTASKSVSNGGTVASGDQIIIDAIDWYQVSSVTGTGVSYTGDTGTQINISTGVVSSATSTTATIATTQYTGTITTGLGTFDAGKVAAWAVTNNKSQDDVASNMLSWYDDYLLNVAPDTNAKLIISSITVGATSATIVITTDKTDTVKHLSGINGTLKYYTTPALGTAFTAAGTVNVTGAGASVSVDVPLASGKFIKAVIE